MIEIPSVLYVGADDYDVELTADKNMDRGRLLGETDVHNSIITINKKQGKSQKRNTLVHELLHAIFWTSGFNRTLEMAKEERIVVALTPWILAALRDNPNLIEFLLEA